MKKKYIIMLVLLLTVGFASLTTSLIVNSKVDLGLLESDLDVIFKEVLLNKETSDKAFIIEDGKSFIYSADDLGELNQTSEIDYTIMNKSHQYDMEVKVSCITDYEDYLSYSSETIDTSILVEAGEVINGNLMTELIKEKEFDDSLVLKCTLYYVPVSRDTVVEDKEYIVSFDTGYDASVEDIKVKYYESYGELPTIERKNYKFQGWYTSENVKVENNSLVKIKDNHTLYAKWEYVCPYTAGQVWTFDYTEAEQTFTVACDGEYKLETWGAQGGTSKSRQGKTYIGGYGANAIGSINLLKDVKLYIQVGGNSNVFNGGIGGGVYSGNSNGGDSTNITLENKKISDLSNSLNSIIIIAAGGGGGYGYPTVSTSDYSGNGGHGGGITGVNGNNSGACYWLGYGGSQISGGTVKYCSGITSSYDGGIQNVQYGQFGNGGDNSGNSGAGGGGGYYGGGFSHYAGGGGGSSYIGNSLLTDKAMYCYNCTTSNEESTKTISTTCTSSTPTANCAKQGNGYAKITYLG